MNASRGFTLLEVLVALAVLATASSVSLLYCRSRVAANTPSKASAMSPTVRPVFAAARSKSACSDAALSSSPVASLMR